MSFPPPPPSSGKGSMEVSRLIAEVHRRPELWDRQHPQHHNRSVLDHHWDSVADLLGITGKAARGKWKNLKDHFRKEYKRCVVAGGNGDQEMSRWPYFYPMMFIREQISHTASDPSAFLSDFQYHHHQQGAGDGGVGGTWYSAGPDAGESPDDRGDDDDDDGGGYRPLNCLHVEYGNRSDQQDENCSDDKHFLLSLLPMFSTLAPDKKLKARIAIETSLLNIAYPDLTVQGSASRGGGGGTAEDGRRSPRHRSVERKSTGRRTKTTTPNKNSDHTPDTTTAPEDTDSTSNATTPATTAAAVVTATATCTAVLKAGIKKRKSENDRLPAQKKACAANAR